jgi:hyaluronate lyase
MQGNLYLDSGLAVNTTNTYTLQAYDLGGNISGMSDPVEGVTAAVGAGVEMILDEADGAPWIDILGSWSLRDFTDAWWGGIIQDDNTGQGQKSVIYRPLLPEAGEYSIYMWWPDRASGAWNIPVDIVSGSFTNTVFINQPQNGGQWNLLATHTLSAGTNTFVRIRNDVTSGYVQADAVRFAK